jgi:hypothetical protein
VKVFFLSVQTELVIGNNAGAAVVRNDSFCDERRPDAPPSDCPDEPVPIGTRRVNPEEKATCESFHGSGFGGGNDRSVNSPVRESSLTDSPKVNAFFFSVLNTGRMDSIPVVLAYQSRSALGGPNPDKTPAVNLPIGDATVAATTDRSSESPVNCPWASHHG